MHSGLRFSSIVIAIGLVLANTLQGVSVAEANDCLICDREIVLDRKLAACFLDRYEILQSKQSGAIAVDLSDCPEPAETPAVDDEQDRGVIEALKMPEASPGQPDPTFMITRAQLSCLKQQLADDGLNLDPAARFDLDDCE